jgi:hypothetical protein
MNQLLHMQQRETNIDMSVENANVGETNTEDGEDGEIIDYNDVEVMAVINNEAKKEALQPCEKPFRN